MTAIEKNLFEFAWCSKTNYDFNAYINELKEMAMSENWGPENKILKNYLSFTFKYLAQRENILGDSKSILITATSACFNTGLFTKYYEPIYAFFNLNKVQRPESPKWFLIGFKVPSDYELSIFENLPDRMNYFEQPEDLIFNPLLKIRINVPHIIGDQENINRLPEELQELPSSKILQTLEGAVSITKKMVASNYTAAVPQFYQGKLQLLLPLYLSNNSNKPDLALTVSKYNKIYTGRTCLSYDMAYNNARLICKPDSSWLRPDFF